MRITVTKNKDLAALADNAKKIGITAQQFKDLAKLMGNNKGFGGILAEAALLMIPAAAKNDVPAFTAGAVPSPAELQEAATSRAQQAKQAEAQARIDKAKNSGHVGGGKLANFVADSLSAGIVPTRFEFGIDGKLDQTLILSTFQERVAAELGSEVKLRGTHVVRQLHEGDGETHGDWTSYDVVADFDVVGQKSLDLAATSRAAAVRAFSATVGPIIEADLKKALQKGQPLPLHVSFNDDYRDGVNHVRDLVEKAKIGWRSFESKTFREDLAANLEAQFPGYAVAVKIGGRKTGSLQLTPKVSGA